MKIYLYGAGNVGRALSAALKAGGARVTLRARRRGFPKRPPVTDLLIVALRDGQLTPWAEERAAAGHRLPPTVHCAGALSAEVLAALRVIGTPVGQLHPLVSLAGGASMRGAYAAVSGDDAVTGLARRAAEIAGMVPFGGDQLDHALYHASASLLANGGAALASAAAEGLVRAGCRPEEVPKMLGALLTSVGHNLSSLGLPAALTGPVRRGDATAVVTHLEVLGRRAPELVALYRAVTRAQLPMARALAEGAAEDFDRIAAILDDEP